MNGALFLMATIWSRKSAVNLFDEAAEGDFADTEVRSMKRTLSATDLTALGVGVVIGAGIFVATGHAAAEYAGPAVVLSFLFGAVACAFAGLCYAEMAAIVPISGSAYTYAYATLGELVAWIIGWDLIIEYVMGGATVAVGWSGYAVSLAREFGLDLPARFTGAPLAYDAVSHTWALTGAVVNVPAMVVVIFTSSLLVAGIRETSRFNNVIVIIKLIVIGLFILCSVPAISTTHWVTPVNPAGTFIPPNAGVGIYGWSGVARGAAVVFFAYIGFDVVSAAAQEAKNPARDMPIGILGSLVICTVVYAAVGFVLTGIVPFDRLNVPDPIAVGIDSAGIGWLGPLIKLGIVFWSHLGSSRAFVGAATAHPRHGARRPAATGSGKDTSAARHTLRCDNIYWSLGSGPRGVVADRLSCRTRQHRNVVRVRCRLSRRSRAPHYPTQPAPPFSRAGDLARCTRGSRDLGPPDAGATARHLD